LDTANIKNLLAASGINVLNIDADFIYIEDPACIVRAFQDFLTYAWVAVCLVTVLLLTLWAIALIRGGKASAMFENIKVLMIIFASISAVGPIMNFIYRGDVFGAWCKVVPVSISNINKTLSIREKIQTAPRKTMPEESTNVQDATGGSQNDTEITVNTDNVESVSIKTDESLSVPNAQQM